MDMPHFVYPADRHLFVNPFLTLLIMPVQQYLRWLPVCFAPGNTLCYKPSPLHGSLKIERHPLPPHSDLVAHYNNYGNHIHLKKQVLQLRAAAGPCCSRGLSSPLLLGALFCDHTSYHQPWLPCRGQPPLSFFTWPAPPPNSEFLTILVSVLQTFQGAEPDTGFSSLVELTNSFLFSFVFY